MLFLGSIVNKAESSYLAHSWSSVYKLKNIDVRQPSLVPWEARVMGGACLQLRGNYEFGVARMAAGSPGSMRRRTMQVHYGELRVATSIKLANRDF